MKSVKLGIIGCGIAARDLHYPALKQLTDQFEITMLCNHTEPKARSLAELVGGVDYTLDYRELLANDDVEAVDIALPIHLNYQVTKEALEAGKHVIVEKPIAANLEDAQKMRYFPHRFDKIMMVAENFRYNPTFYRIKEIIKVGKIGEIYAVFWNLFNSLGADNKYVQTEWRRKHQYPGGFIMDAGVHNIAALRFLFGNLINGRALARNINPEIGEMDSFIFQFETVENVIGSLNIFFSVKGLSDYCLKILGTRGSIISRGHEIRINTDQENIEHISSDDGYKPEFENFYNAIQGNEKVVYNFSEAYNDFKILAEAIERC